jgi:hypothetical protein
LQRKAGRVGMDLRFKGYTNIINELEVLKTVTAAAKINLNG